MTEIENLLKSETKSLMEYLNIDTGVYEIPFNQRNYEWGTAQVKRFWNDLVNLDEGNEDEHLLNFFTLYKSEDQNKTYNVYDGQQRTITCLLILANISREFNRMDSDVAKQLSEEIQKSYFRKYDIFNADSDAIYKIRFDNQSDSDFFYRLTSNKYENNTSNIDAKKLDNNGTKKALLSSYKTISDYLEEFISQHQETDTVDLLREFCNIMLNKCYLIVLTAYDDDIAAKMFESLNNTGKDLEKYYVFKNDLVRCLGEDNVKDTWMEIENNLENQNRNKFLRAFATLTNGETSQAKVLDAIYDSFDINSNNAMAKENGKKLLSQLVKASREYRLILNPHTINDDTDGAKRFKKLDDYVDKFNFEQHVPIILSMLMKKKTFNEIADVLWAIIVLDVRNFYINGAKSNMVAKSFANYAQAIFSDNLSTDDVVNNIYQFVKKDANVRQNILDKRFKMGFKANKSVRALLTIVYNNKLKNSELEIDADKVDLEHILPRTPKSGSQWLDDFPNIDERENYTYQVGNLTLWFKDVNRSNANVDFKVKRVQYKNSPLIENQMIANNKEWTSKQIKDRTDKLADDILETFVRQ